MIKKKMDKASRSEGITVDISNSESAQFTNSVAFGETVTDAASKSLTSSNSHCVDEGLAKTTSSGTRMENNGQVSKTKSRTDYKDKSSELNLGLGRSWPEFPSDYFLDGLC